jgi:hypothetical protein
MQHCSPAARCFPNEYADRLLSNFGFLRDILIWIIVIEGLFILTFLVILLLVRRFREKK